MDTPEKNTQDLIDSLSRDLPPVRRLPSAFVQAEALTLLALAAALVPLWLAGGRDDLYRLLGSASYLCENAALLAAALLAGVSAFRLSVPDTKLRMGTIFPLLLSLSLWLGIIIYHGASAPLHPPHIHEGPEALCLQDLALIAALPAVAGMFLLMRGAAVWLGWAGFAALLSVCSAGALGMRLLCGNDDPLHLLVWHFLPVLGISLAGALAGKILLKKFSFS